MLSLRFDMRQLIIHLQREEHLSDVSNPVGTSWSNDVETMLYRRYRRWYNVVSTSFEHDNADVQTMLYRRYRRWYNVVSISFDHDMPAGDIRISICLSNMIFVFFFYLMLTWLLTAYDSKFFIYFWFWCHKKENAAEIQYFTSVLSARSIIRNLVITFPLLFLLMTALIKTTNIIFVG